MRRRKEYRASIIFAAAMAAAALEGGSVRNDRPGVDEHEVHPSRHYIADRRVRYRDYGRLDAGEQRACWSAWVARTSDSAS